MSGTAPTQAVISDDGEHIRLTTYDATAAALTVVELSPLAALRLAYGACRKPWRRPHDGREPAPILGVT